MSLNIKNAETERLARELAAATGETITQAVTVAVRERLDRVGPCEADRVARRLAELLRISEDTGPRWKEPWRSADHGDLLYGDRGLPN